MSFIRIYCETISINEENIFGKIQHPLVIRTLKILV